MKKIPEYWLFVTGSTKYQVSNYGNFRKILKTGKIKPIKTYFKSLKHTQWLYVKVEFNSVYKEYPAQVIVADVYIDKPKDKSMVLHHKNHLITDNYAGNLEWITRKELGIKSGGTTRRSVPVVKYDKDTGEILDFYRSISQAAKDNFISKETICLAVKGKLKTAAGFVWKKETLEFEDPKFQKLKGFGI